jgi:soluble lytic murein transglycosylase-like protein
MCFLMVLACLALTNDATLASSKPVAASLLPNNPAGSTRTNPCKLSPHFPPSILQWCDLITTYAEKHNLPPGLIAALIWQESGGDPTAYSSSGAVGLMQVMPRDGLAANFVCVNGPCFASRPAMQELLDPEFNIDYGTRMLASLFSRHQNMRDALMRYGPMDVGYSYADKVLSIYERYQEE